MCVYLVTKKETKSKRFVGIFFCCLLRIATDVCTLHTLNKKKKEEQKKNEQENLTDDRIINRCTQKKSNTKGFILGTDTKKRMKKNKSWEKSSAHRLFYWKCFFMHSNCMDEMMLFVWGLCEFCRFHFAGELSIHTAEWNCKRTTINICHSNRNETRLNTDSPLCETRILYY